MKMLEWIKTYNDAMITLGTSCDCTVEQADFAQRNWLETAIQNACALVDWRNHCPATQKVSYICTNTVPIPHKCTAFGNVIQHWTYCNRIGADSVETQYAAWTRWTRSCEFQRQVTGPKDACRVQEGNRMAMKQASSSTIRTLSSFLLLTGSSVTKFGTETIRRPFI
jgi:hypothetical protein